MKQNKKKIFENHFGIFDNYERKMKKIWFLKKIRIKQKDKINWKRFENQFWKDKKLEKILKLILKKIWLKFILKRNWKGN